MKAKKLFNPCPIFDSCGYKAINFQIFPGEFIIGKLAKYYRDYYFNVYIFSRKSSMYKFRELLQLGDDIKKVRNYNFEAMTSSYKSRYDENEHQFGNILFYQDSAKKSGIVSHEFLHASIFFWCSVMKEGTWEQIPENMDYHEVLCYMHGDMVANYWKNWYKYIGDNK